MAQKTKEQFVSNLRKAGLDIYASDVREYRKPLYYSVDVDWYDYDVEIRWYSSEWDNPYGAWSAVIDGSDAIYAERPRDLLSMLREETGLHD